MALCWPLQMRPPAKAVLVSLADMANDEGYCWPTIDKLCERTCYGRTAVIEAVAWLESRGAVRASRSNGRKTTYWVEPGKFTAQADDAAQAAPNNPPNQSATRTGAPRGPVRHADPTSPPRGLNQSATRTLIPKNRQEPSEIPPQPPAVAGGACERDAVQADTQTPKAGKGASDDGFDAFWQAFPRREAEKAARRQWARLKPDAAVQAQILSAVAAWSATERWQDEGGRYVPRASGWLSGERWRDVLPMPALPPLPADWWQSLDGIKAMGERLGIAYDAAGLGNAWTDDELRAFNRAYRERVFAAAGPGVWHQLTRRAA
jgi:hypothetical protein